MILDSRVCYAALKANDSRFDGHFFVGVSSTGIYCRPVCRARLPKFENCTFFATAAQAEQAGFRPCLLCRPELAPHAAPLNTAETLANRAARYLEKHCESLKSIEELANHLGCTDRQLRRVFSEEYHVSPIQYLQTCRLLLAKSLLTDTDLSIIDVAMAAGFGSLRRFNDLFKKQYRLVPSALRRKASGAKEQKNSITLLLGYRPPYQFQKLLNFFALRAIPGVETICEDEYCRTVRIVTEKRKEYCGFVRVGHLPQKNSLAVTLDAALLPVIPRALTRIRHLFDLNCDPNAIYETLASMDETRPGLFVSGTRLPGCFDAFEMAVRAVLGQQITVKAASTLAGRFAQTYGVPIKTEIEGLNRCFPIPETILALEGSIENHLGPLGITAARAKTILKLAQVFANRTIDFDCCYQPEAEIKKLLDIPGIGDWTAQYIAMRAMGWPDAFPHTDYGVKKALTPLTPKEILSLAERWRPWRSYATISLWNSL